MAQVTSFDYIETTTEKDALLLEQNLINKYEPKYNIRIKFGTTYPYIQVIFDNVLQVKLSNKVIKKKDHEFFGPFPEGYGAPKIVKLINALFPIAKCKSPNSGKECINYEMGKCLGECIRKVSPDEYSPYYDEITNFLKGNTAKIIKRINLKIDLLSLSEDFETAIKYRDLLDFVDKYSEKQTAYFNDSLNRDFIASYDKEGFLSISISFVRFGKLVLTKNFTIRSYDTDDESSVESFIINYYKTALKPDVLYVENDSKVLEDLLGFEVMTPQKGKTSKLLINTYEHAKQSIEKDYDILLMKSKKFEASLKELQQITNIKNSNNIELVDISSFQGENQVGVVVAFKNGIPNKARYRKYIINTVEGMDDYASIYETIYRHIRRKLIDKVPMPELLLVDGKIQTKFALDAIKELHQEDKIRVIGLVKNSRHDTDALYIDGKIVPIPMGSPLYLLLGSMQDEVHRFAINFMRKRKSNKLLTSELSDIKGITEDDINLLYRQFGSIREVRLANPGDIVKVLGKVKGNKVNTYFE
jgi:excinuclease ABC subunit C